MARRSVWEGGLDGSGEEGEGVCVGVGVVGGVQTHYIHEIHHE